MPYQGTTVRIKNTLTDYDGSKLTPDSQEVKIYDPDDTLKDTNTNPTLESEGVYYVDYTIPSDGKEGTWKVVWKAVKDSKPNIDISTFDVSVP